MDHVPRRNEASPPTCTAPSEQHDATGQYLIGNADAQKEKAVSADLSLRFPSGRTRAASARSTSAFGTT